MNENMTKYRRIISALSVAIVILLLSNYSALRKLDIATRGNFDEPEYIEEPEFETILNDESIESSGVIVLVIDDFGYRNDSVSDGFLNLPIALTCAVLPGHPQSSSIAKKAISRKTGARGLRSILEEILLDSMYEIPSDSNINEVVLNEDVVLGKSKPIVAYAKNKKEIETSA